MAIQAARTMRLPPYKPWRNRHLPRRLLPMTVRHESSSSPPPRNPILTLRTPTPSATPRPPWSTLSAPAKAARAAEQSFNFALVSLGLGLTGAVAYFLWTTVLAPDGPTAAFNRAADEVRADARAQALLVGGAATADAAGERSRARAIRAYGEPTRSRWARNRPVAARVRKTGPDEAEEMSLRFYVEGPAAKGTVRARLVRERPGEPFEYRSLTLDVPGAKRVHLRSTEPTKEEEKRRSISFMGFKWK